MAVECYADSSFLVSLYRKDENQDAAKTFIARTGLVIAFSPLNRIELRNALRHAQTFGQITESDRRAAFNQIANDFEAGLLTHLPVEWTNVFRGADKLSEEHLGREARGTIHLLHVAIAVECGQKFSLLRSAPTASGRDRWAKGETMTFSPEEDFALQLDADDPLRNFRERFHLPLGADGMPLIYWAGNSLGLMPKSAREIVGQELSDWATLGVDAHLEANTPWYSYHEALREPMARLAGGRPEEVICMNSLTVNLHLMMATFYRPTKSRFRILMEEPAFPSDTYAIKTQIAHHGFDPQEALLLARAREGEFNIRAQDIEALLQKEGEQIALVMFGGVNFFTGQLFDIAAVTMAAQKRGITVGIDLAHAIGNVPLALHDWNVDFAVWCSYKYLNGGPGAIAGAFVHERHATNTSLPRLGGWFGNDPNTRFRLHLEPEFVPVPSADGWQISNPPILSMAPLRASLAIFEEAGGMEPLRAKSIRLTGYLQFLLDRIGSDRFSVITPRQPDERGCQLSILAHKHPKELFEKLEAAGITCDFREPNVIRAAPTPLYNTFHEVWRFAQILAEDQ